jgi:hypothetical protein
MDEPSYPFGESCAADVFCAAHVDGLIVLHRTPDTYHRSKVKDGFRVAHRLDEGLWLTDITPVDSDTTVREPGRVLGGQGEYTHRVAPVL